MPNINDMNEIIKQKIVSKYDVSLTTNVKSRLFSAPRSLDEPEERGAQRIGNT